MKISRPHRPAHESDKFWYYPKEAILLYENKGAPHPNYLEAEHSQRGRQEHRDAGPRWGEHWDPHGIEFKSCSLTPEQQEKNAVNAEFVVRMCHELGLVSHGSESTGEREGRKDRLLPVPKFLALFLETSRTRMYEPESITQAVVLMQTRTLIDTNYTAHLSALP